MDKNIPYIEDLIEQIESVFEHDQLLGQWLVNKIRVGIMIRNEGMYLDSDIVRYSFNIENKELLELIGNYNK